MKILLMIISGIFIAMGGTMLVQRMALDGPIGYNMGLVAASAIMVIGYIILEVCN